MKQFIVQAGLLLATSFAQAATISLVGTQHDDGAWWRTAASNKVHDVDGNHVLGSDGFEVVNRAQAKPSYIDTMGILTGTYPGNGLYALIDDPASPPALFVSGTMNPYPGTGVWTNLHAFTMNANVNGRRVRVGLLVDNLDIAGFNSYRMALAQAGAGGTTVEVDTTSAPYNNRSPDWIFFDIAGAASGDVFLVRGQGGANVTATLGGLAFDSVGAGTVRYVAPSGSHTFPYTNWLSAATNIQDAIDASPTGTLVLVSNGVYATGGRTVTGGLLTNRVVIDRAIRVESVNGPAVTTITGQGPVGDSAVRCVWMAPGARLSGFTLTNGATRSVVYSNYVDGYGGCLRAEGASTLVSNCVLTAGASMHPGSGAAGGNLILCDLIGNTKGGAYSSTLTRCYLSGNSGSYGGAAHQSTLVQCSLVGNTASDGGGAFDCTLTQCSIFSNTATLSGGGGVYLSRLDGCILQGNWVSDRRMGGGAYLSVLSNCLLVGNSSMSFRGGGAADSTLYNCTVTSNSASVGAGTFNASHFNCIVWGNNGPQYEGGLSLFDHSCTTPLPAGAGNIDADPVFANHATGDYRIVLGSPCLNAGTNAFMTGAQDVEGAARIKYGTVDMGAYEMVLPTGMVHYVAMSNATPAFPYLTWTTAAPHIQTAVDIASAGSTVLVSNGVYTAGGPSAQVFIEQPIQVRSVNGPSATVIDGGGTKICVQLTNGSFLAGFTLTNGFASYAGGGVLCEWGGATVSNCVITGNRSDSLGGGVAGHAFGVGTSLFIDCDLIGNSSEGGGGGAYSAHLIRCHILGNRVSTSQFSQGFGGGAYDCRLERCVVADNIAFEGGGVYGPFAVENCLIKGNHATYSSGGVEADFLANSTVVSNSAGAHSGGTYVNHIVNSIVYLNSAPGFPNAQLINVSNSCIEAPLPAGNGNFTNHPAFVNPAAGDYRLQPDSPCVNSGQNAAAPGPTDLAGLPRIALGTVDVGAYEYDGASDRDTDGFTDAEEYIANTQPTNALSFFHLARVTNAPAGTLALVIGETSTGRVYSVFVNTNLAAAPQTWTLVPPEQTGTASALTVTITNTLPAANYRTGVRLP